MIALFSLVSILVTYSLYIPLPTSAKPFIFYANAKRDDLKLTVLKVIKQAKESLWIYSYGMTDPEVLNALQRQAASGVCVKLFYDDAKNRKLHQQLENEHVHCYPIKGKGLMHEKLLIVDSSLVFFGSTNITSSSLAMHDNCLLGFYAPKLATLLHKKRLPHYHYVFPKQTLDLFTLPEAKEEALNTLIDRLNHAKKRVTIALFTFTHPLLVDTLISLHERGVKVKLFLDGYTARGASKKAVIKLSQAKVPIAISQGPALFHHKWALIDDETLVLGSANWTKSAFEKNADLLLFLSPLNQKQVSSLHRTMAIFESEIPPLKGPLA